MNIQPIHPRRVLLRSLLAAAVLSLAACSSSNDDDTSGDTDNPTMMPDGSTQFIVALGPDQEVPSVLFDGATGEGNLMINLETGAATGSVAVSGLSGAAQMAHIHRAFAGTNGDVEITLEGNADGSLWSVPADTVLDAIQLDALANGELYLNVHTADNVSGEIRGQIVPMGVEVRRSTLSGDNEVPAVTSAGSGSGVATVNSATGAISAAIFTTGADDATMAHIHIGVAGENGEVIIPLAQDPGNVTIWRTAVDAPALTAMQMQALAADGLYFNVHTPANPGGELRGQL